MSKIVQAANSMIGSQEKITDVTNSRGQPSELYFLFDQKYVWSIREDLDEFEGDYFLYYYPEYQSVAPLTDNNSIPWSDIKFMTYSAKQLGTTEARNTFAELYSVVKEKLFGLDHVLEDIISNNAF